MSGIILCSHQSDVPYHIEELNINIYSIEELAYYLYNNVYFINRDFFNETLIAHIRDVWNMEELSEKLHRHLAMNDNYAECVITVVKAAAYYSDDEVGDLELLLDKIGDKSLEERKILRAQTFMERGKYSAACRIYREIIDSHRKGNVSGESMAKVWYNMGIIDAHRFMYGNAAECFERSEEIVKDNETEEKFIQCCVLGRLERRLERFAVRYNISDEKIERIRLRIIENKNSIKEDDSTVKLNNSLIFDGSVNLDEYYRNIDSVLEGWKNEYREEME